MASSNLRANDSQVSETNKGFTIIDLSLAPRQSEQFWLGVSGLLRSIGVKLENLLGRMAAKKEHTIVWSRGWEENNPSGLLKIKKILF